MPHDSESSQSQQSPDGPAAHPERSPRTIAMSAALIVVGVLVVAVVLAVAGWPMLGAGVGALGLLIFLANPTVWANILRARERSKNPES